MLFGDHEEDRRKRRERVSLALDMQALKSQIETWSKRCSLCYIQGYCCSRDHKTTQCPMRSLASIQKMRKIRSTLRTNMVLFRARGGSFCSGQCQLPKDLTSTQPSSTLLKPECACEIAVLECLSVAVCDPEDNRLDLEIEELRRQGTDCESKDLHAWLCSTEHVGGRKSATATKVFAHLNNLVHRKATPEPT
jgi:hypothetical protein